MTDTNQLGPIVENWAPPPRPQRAVLEGRYARLEPISADAHAGDLFEANAEDTEGRIFKYLLQEPFASRSAYSRWVRQIENSDDPMFFAVRNLETGRWSGVLSLMRINPEAGSIEVGNINFSPSLQHTRAASEAIILTARLAFQLGYRRFEWKCNALNIPSRRAAQRFGFSFEGVFRQALIVKGRNRDTAWFAMIDKEFPELEAAYARWLDPENFRTDGQQIRRLSDMTAPVLVARDPALTP